MTLQAIIDKAPVRKWPCPFNCGFAARSASFSRGARATQRHAEATHGDKARVFYTMLMRSIFGGPAEEADAKAWLAAFEAEYGPRTVVVDA